MRKNVHLICGGRYHDFDFARLELLKLLAEQDHVRVTVASSYEDQDSLHRADALITYTCDLLPLEGEQDGLQQFLREGGKWFALHGTNCRMRYNETGGYWEAPPVAPRFFDMLGSRFEACAPVRPYTIRPSQPHPLVDGIEPFTVEDELYLCNFRGPHRCLVETRFSGMTKGFEKRHWRGREPVPVMYLHPWEDNEVLYLSLGHARSHYDMQPQVDFYPAIERGSWVRPEFHDLLRRGIRWALGELT